MSSDIMYDGMNFKKVLCPVLSRILLNVPVKYLAGKP